MTRTEVLKWHLGALRALFSCCCSKEVNENENMSKDYMLIHHRNCYGYLVKHGTEGALRKVSAVDGIRMAEYMDRYEKKNLTKIHHHDRAKLTQLTSNTLFCRYCFQPIDETHYQSQLTSPFMA